MASARSTDWTPAPPPTTQNTRLSKIVSWLIQSHFLEEGFESRVLMQRGQQKRSLDAVRRSRASRDCLLQKIHRAIVVAQSDIDVCEVVRRDVGALRPLLELAQNRPRFPGIAHHRVSLAELTQPERVRSRHGNRAFHLRQAFGSLPAQEIRPAEGHSRPV